jgi:hypothetical protein
MEDGATDDFGLPSGKIHNHSEHHSGRNAWAWVVLWLAPLFATVGPSDDPAVARMKHTYGDVLRTRHTVHEISKVMAENRFVLNRPPVTRELIQLGYFREVDGVEVLIT